MSTQPLPPDVWSLKNLPCQTAADSWQRWLVELDCLVESKAEYDTIAGHLAWRPDRAYRRWIAQRHAEDALKRYGPL